MNRWQIICPVVAILLFALAVGALSNRAHTREAYFAGASLAGRDLITTTNSDRIASIPPALKTALTTFLASPAKSAGIRGQSADAGHPETPRATVMLANDAGERLDITLCWQSNLRKFIVVAFTNQPSATRQ